MYDDLAIDPNIRPRTPAAVSRRYIVLWVGLAGVALLYIATLTTRPDIVATYLPDPRAEAPAAASSADVATMRSTIAQLNAELAEAKSTARTSETRIAMLIQRVAELESRAAAGPVAAADPAATAATQSAPAVPAQPAAAVEPAASVIARKFAASQVGEQKPVEIVKPAVKTLAAVKGAAPHADTGNAAGIETGSLSAPPASVAIPATPSSEAAPVSFGPAIVKPAVQPFGLELGRGSSTDQLRLTWNLLSEQNAPVLKGLAPHYAATSDAADATLNLIAGPVKSKAEAIRVCKALQAKGVGCKVAPFNGEAL